jgi:hypothetical protein
MKLTINTCYSRILYVMCSGESYSSAVFSMQIIKGPFHASEGLAGYIETVVEFHLKDLAKFTELWESWFKLPDTQRNQFYSLARGWEVT